MFSVLLLGQVFGSVWDGLVPKKKGFSAFLAAQKSCGKGTGAGKEGGDKVDKGMKGPVPILLHPPSAIP